MTKLSRNAALLVVVGVSGGLLALLSASKSSWPLWAQCAVGVMLVVTFPLLNALGVLEAIGLKDMPGARFNARYMFIGLALFVGAFAWVFVFARAVPYSSVGVLVLLFPPALALVGGLICFIKGTFGPKTRNSA